MLADTLLKVLAMKFQEEAEHKYRPRPSMAGPERCIRQTVYSAMGESKRPLPGRAVAVFSDSSWAEETTADLIRQSAYQIHSEQMPITIPDAFPWRTKGHWVCDVCGEKIPNKDCHGHIDYIVTDMMAVDHLVEHKALSHFGFEGMMNGSLPLDYFTQLAIYMNGAQRLNPDLQSGILLVKNKNQSGYLEFTCQYHLKTDTFTVLERIHHTGDRQTLNLSYKKIVESAFFKFASVEGYRKAKVLPDRPYDYDHWRCQYCQFTKTCWQNYVPEFNEMSTDAVVAEGHIVELIDKERDLAQGESVLIKKRKALRVDIKKVLKEHDIRHAFIGEKWELTWKAGTMEKLDPELLHPSDRKKATIEVPTDRLTIKKVKYK